MPEDNQPTPDNGDDHDASTCDGSCGIQHDSWQSLPAPERREHVLSEIAAGRWLGLLRTPVDSDLLDVIACIRAIQDENNDALAVIIRNGNAGGMLITTLKMLAEGAADQGLDIDFLGVWGSFALARSSS